MAQLRRDLDTQSCDDYQSRTEVDPSLTFSTCALAFNVSVIAMRLLNANTLSISNYFGDIPPYAILSHVWGDEEVSLQDFEGGKADELKGYAKILGCCKQAIADSLEHVWIDTCCIDKTSSSELQEAINSMFNFYRDSAICYAYLQDVANGADTLSLNSGFSKSHWFSRGWTLQELLAPSLVEFYASDWTPLGTRDDLKKTISLITKIDQEFFTYGKFSDYSIAQKFSWASGRKTTRVEDEAYCLLGVFGVSMPLLYGEGRRAFMRLQEELMRVSDDQSIFAWTNDKTGGLFASSPAAFADSGNIIRGEQDFSLPPYSITNKGISIHLPLIEPESGYAIPYMPSLGTSYGGSGNISITLTPTGSLAILNCQSKKTRLSRIAIVVEQTEKSTRYSRTNISLGLLPIPLADVRGKAKQKNLLIQPHGIDEEGVGWSSQKRGQLVIIQGLSFSETVFKLIRTGSDFKCHTLSNGAVSFRIPPTPYGIEYNQASLQFAGQEGGSFIIAITISGTYPRRSLIAEIKEIYRASPLHPVSFDGTAIRLRAEKLPHVVLVSFPAWYFSEEEFIMELAMLGQNNPPPALQLSE